MRSDRLIVTGTLHQQHVSLSDVEIHDHCRSGFADVVGLRLIATRSA